MLKMSKDQNNQDNEDDCKPSVQEKKQADKEYESDSATDSEKPKRKKRQRTESSRRKEPSRFSLGCEVFHKEIEFGENDEPLYIDQFKFKYMAQEAQLRFVELDALRSGYQLIMDVYKDPY